MTEALTRARPRIDDPEELDRVVQADGRSVRSGRGLSLRLARARRRRRGQRLRPDARARGRQFAAAIPARPSGTPLAATGSTSIRSSPGRRPFAWRRHEVGTLEYKVQVDGIRLYPLSGADLRADEAGRMEQGPMNANVVDEWLERVEARPRHAARSCARAPTPMPDQAAYHVQQAAEKLDEGGAARSPTSRPARATTIGEFAKRLPAPFGDRERFLALDALHATASGRTATPR